MKYKSLDSLSGDEKMFEKWFNVENDTYVYVRRQAMIKAELKKLGYNVDIVKPKDIQLVLKSMQRERVMLEESVAEYEDSWSFNDEDTFYQNALLRIEKLRREIEKHHKVLFEMEMNER